MIEARGVNHIGIAVRSLDEHREFYEKTLGATFEGEEVVEEQKVRVGFFALGSPGHEVRLELLQPTSDDSPISAFLDKRGEGLHHVAYTVANIEQRLASLKESGVRMIDESPRDGAHHSRIAFLHPKASKGVLTELCEPADH
ncbi:MAG: methylmalonyl-CoA epimerase [Planctomycetota bacterium]